jgi:HrpA-like RNA helicase
VEEHLPALLAASAKHAVLCVDGETGCGKSTMVPLALLRAAGPRGLVIVTQPRRVAAASLARRVAHTIGEPLGESVGYAIGQERVASSRTRLLFVTTGWLLRLAASARAGGDAEFARATHVVLDEAHDRSLDADFLSLLIKRRLAALGAGRRCPKIVVMSATLQAGVFGAYFGSVASAAPVVHVGARRFPVREIYLDELTSALGVTRPSLLAAASAESSDSAAIISDSASSKRSRRAPRAACWTLWCSWRCTRRGRARRRWSFCRALLRLRRRSFRYSHTAKAARPSRSFRCTRWCLASCRPRRWSRPAREWRACC